MTHTLTQRTFSLAASSSLEVTLQVQDSDILQKKELARNPKYLDESFLNAH